MNTYTSRYTFSIAFEGEATADYSMSVGSWATSLLGWNDLVSVTTQGLYPIRPTDLRVTSTRRGSFITDLDLQSHYEEAGFILRTILQLCRIRRSQRPSNKELEAPAPAAGQSVEQEQLYVGETEIDATLGPDNMARLLDSPTFQAAFKRSLEPLNQPGITKM